MELAGDRTRLVEVPSGRDPALDYGAAPNLRQPATWRDAAATECGVSLRQFRKAEASTTIQKR